MTLFGESAGSVSVSLHLLHEPSWDKFQRAILQSGAAVMPRQVLEKADALKKTRMVVTEEIKCPDGNVTKVCMTNVSDK